MTLRQRQSIFMRNIAQLILFAFEQGYELTAGEMYRTQEQQDLHRAAGRSQVKVSQHQKRLAVDLNLFIDGKYVSSSDDHRILGEYWKSLHPDNRWGGDFKSLPDGNHYEMRG